jgi:hypothetical protein
MRLFRAASERFAADQARLAEFVQAKRRRRRLAFSRANSYFLGMSWSLEFDDPIELPSGVALRTRDRKLRPSDFSR